MVKAKGFDSCWLGCMRLRLDLCDRCVNVQDFSASANVLFSIWIQLGTLRVDYCEWIFYRSSLEVLRISGV